MNDNPRDETDAADAALLDELRTLIAEVDPVPVEVVLAARSAIAHRDLDRQLLALVEVADTGVRGAAGTDVATFADAVREISLTIAPPAGAERTRRVVGEVDPPAVAFATLQVTSSRTPTHVDILLTIDASGLFTVDVPPNSHVRLLVDWPDGTSAVTPWTPV